MGLNGIGVGIRVSIIVHSNVVGWSQCWDLKEWDGMGVSLGVERKGVEWG